MSDLMNNQPQQTWARRYDNFRLLELSHRDTDIVLNILYNYNPVVG